MTTTILIVSAVLITIGVTYLVEEVFTKKITEKPNTDSVLSFIDTSKTVIYERRDNGLFSEDKTIPGIWRETDFNNDLWLIHRVRINGKIITVNDIN